MPATTGNSQPQFVYQPPNNMEREIRNVWAYNLEEEFQTIRQIVQTYNYVAMHTEFPGVVSRPIGDFTSASDFHYQLMSVNVNLLRLIQLGLTFLDANGNMPENSSWQFNFKFDLREDLYAQDSIELLRHSGVDFQKHEDDGIDHLQFAEILMTSGLVLMDNVKWLSFHSAYDFGYLTKLLINRHLPDRENDFYELLKMYFPNIYDVKYLMISCHNVLSGGIQQVAQQFGLERTEPQQQAGSDALLIGMVFFKIKVIFLDNTIDDSKFLGHIYGLGTSATNGTTNETNGHGHGHGHDEGNPNPQ